MAILATLIVPIIMLPILCQSQDYCELNWPEGLCQSNYPEKCYKSYDSLQTIEVHKESFKMHCNYKNPYDDAIECSNMQVINHLTMVDCSFPNFSLQTFLHNKNPLLVFVEYTSSQPLKVELNFNNVYNIHLLSIKNPSAGERFRITFGEGSQSINSLQIEKHSFKTFGIQLTNLTGLKTLKIRYGMVETVKRDMLSGFSNILENLDLSWNRIDHIEPNALKNLNKLQTLYLTGNFINSIREEHFSDLNVLQYLKLDMNNLTIIPKHLISNLVNLILLDISGNRGLQELPAGFLDGIKNMKYFFASNCSLSKLRPTLFSGISFFRLISASNMQFASSLFHCRMRETLKHEDVRFVKSSISYLPRNEIRVSITSSYNSKILEVNISHNKLTSIPPKIFNSLTRLELLNISHNPLATLPQNEPFGPSVNLKISAEYCKLKQFPKVNWWKYRFLVLDLSHNLITNPTLPVCLPSEVIVKLYSNNISTITLNRTCALNSKIPKYFLANNSLICNCSLHPFLDYVFKKMQQSKDLFPDLNTLRCRGNNNELKHANLQCLAKVCPDGCICNKAITNCSSNDRIRPPLSITKNSTIVLLNNNKIQSLQYAIPQYWNHVIELNISHNLLKSLNDWNIPQKLRILDARYNHLSYLPTLLMNKVEESIDFEIYLSNNKWECNCDFVAFKEWFMNNKDKIKDYHKTSCEQDTGNGIIINIFIKYASVDDFCSDVRVDTRISIVLIPIFLVAIFVFGFYYKHTVFAVLYYFNLLPCVHFNGKGQKKRYDAFVCADVADRDVVLQLIRELEPRWRLCIPERDWGELRNIKRSSLVIEYLKKSRNTLIVISKQSLQEVWIRVTILGAYNLKLEDGVHKLIFIVVGDIKNILMKHDVQQIFTNQPYLEWGERWFWQKLIYDLRKPNTTMDIQ